MSAVDMFGDQGSAGEGASHFHRPVDAPFRADEQGRVTILLGGLTWKHEALIAAVLRAHGHPAECLPVPDRQAHEIGKEYSANGLCNPAYFVVGALIRRLRELEESGLSPAEIVRNYVFLTAGSCGPCRFGMYESEFRVALAAAGYRGFRVILFMQDDGMKASVGQAGLEFSVDFGMSVFHAFILGDLVNDIHRKLHAYEAAPGEADRTVTAVVASLAEYFENPKYFDLADSAPRFLRAVLQHHRSKAWFRKANTLCKVLLHLYGNQLTTKLRECRNRIAAMRLNRLQAKPLVKVIGEFWAQLTEGDGNFRMFQFLESEGAEVHIEPIGCWLLYLLHQAKRRLETQHRLTRSEHRWPLSARALRQSISIAGKHALFSIGEHIYRSHYERLAKALGDFSGPLLSQQALEKIANPYYSTGLRGGEGHLEVAKNLYYTRQRKSHMVVSLKPFGCMPSMQSDAVQAALMDRIPEMMFVPIETSGDGEIHAYSRIQMVLGDAKQDARREFQRALAATHRSFDELSLFVQSHPELQSAAYKVTRRPGVISTAANFILDLNELLGRISDAGPRSRRSRSATREPAQHLQGANYE
jgi:predicted nucleotide-binding protein (sugar kinase/HSP70/actin superfamily)